MTSRSTGTRSLALAPFLLAFAGACVSCPTPPALETLPGKDFATPASAFAYLKEAMILGAENDSYAYHEFRCFSARLRRERNITLGDYFFVRSDVVATLREKIGDFERIRLDSITALGPDRAELLLTGGGKAARAIVVRENGYEVRFRDRAYEAFGDVRKPSDALAIERGVLTARFAVDEALAENPGLTADDVYEVRFVSEWKFYAVEGTDLVDDLKRRIDEKHRAAESPPPLPK